jgi:hypothetical protein
MQQKPQDAHIILIVWLKFGADSNLQIYAHIGLLKKTVWEWEGGKGRVMAATSQWHPMIEGDDGTIVCNRLTSLSYDPPIIFVTFFVVLLEWNNASAFKGLLWSSSLCNLIYDHHHTHSSYILPLMLLNITVMVTMLDCTSTIVCYWIQGHYSGYL